MTDLFVCKKRAAYVVIGDNFSPYRLCHGNIILFISCMRLISQPLTNISIG
jgi:hypothetical protein